MILEEASLAIDKLHFDDTLAQRTISIDMYQKDGNTVIDAWQCNMARLKTADLKLPTVLRFIVDATGCVLNAELMEDFKGSQGMPCSQRYLNRILKREVLGLNFDSNDTILHNENMLHCRHIFELTAASMTFFRYCRSGPEKHNRIYESTKAYSCDNGLFVRDEYTVNGKTTVIEEILDFSSGDLTMLSNGKLGSIKKLCFKAKAVRDDETVFTASENLVDITGSSNAIMSMMKMFAKPWKSLGKSMGIRRNFYFTNLVPSSLYGVLVQAIALTIFPNNYNYFQHSLAGLQRNDNVPLCIGMVLEPAEIKRFFPDFENEDMFG